MLQGKVKIVKTYATIINNKIYLKNLGYFDTIAKLMYAHRKLLEIIYKNVLNRYLIKTNN